ncbi:flagellar hook-basal body complex protein [Oscillospiraceae bacterium MB08-C2-2]|nr:flagellar hook-basal body complex protein [Oscillospiraceae bacterium MB08-C2-2]
MMRSLSSAVAGLKSHQTKMDVIGNNIANVNTYGFKRSRVTFADVYYQSLSSGSKPGTTTGGTNPTQIGYGSAVATTDVLISQAGSASTGRAMDVYISGDGYLTVKDASGNNLYTRLGILGFDANGNIIDSNGNFVQGINVEQKFNADGTLDESALRSLSIPTDILNELTGLGVNNNGDIVGTKPGATTIKASAGLSEYYDLTNLTIAEGSNYSGKMQMKVGALPKLAQMQGAFNWITDVQFGDMAFANNDFAFSYTNGTPGELKMTVDGTSYTANVTANGTFDLKDSSGKVGMVISTGATIPTAASSTTFAAADIENLYQVKVTDKGGNLQTFPAGPSAFTAGSVITAGDIKFTLGTVTKPYFGEMATITSDTETITFGTLALAKFPNAMALEQTGDSYFAASANSGEAEYSRPGSKGTGALASNYLEMSNVDISQEFTDMITTQRGFQANTRIITVSDEMLQELVNLKR